MDLRKELKYYFGFDTFKNLQEDIIHNILAGKNTFVLMPTGGGKSLCYQLPALISKGTAIVVSPLIALMKNQVDAIRCHVGNNRVAHFINSSLTKNELEEVKQNLLQGETKLLYVAPESLIKEENIKLLKQIPISFYAIDEAHCISEWGHDFRPEYRRIQEIIPQIALRCIVALTATATPKVQDDILKCLQIPEATVFKSSFNRPNLYYEIREKTDQADKEIVRYIKTHPEDSGIIYCTSRSTVEKVANLLQTNGIKALPYHAGMETQIRSETQEAFLNEEIKVIVATIAFGMGIDKPDVRFVIHYNLPKSLESYYQETGRAGRDGKLSTCITFYSEQDTTRLDKFLQHRNKLAGEREICKHLLEDTVAYAKTQLCRRIILLNYFGEKYSADMCHNCDNCKKVNIIMDVKDKLVDILETVTALKGKFKTEHILDFLCGKETAEIEAFKHNEQEGFGCLQNESRNTLEAIIQQAVIEGYIERNVDEFGTLKITAAGKKFLKKPKAFKVALASDEEEENEESAKEVASSGGATDPQLFAMLKDLRKKIAKKLNLPPYVIFQEQSLEDMATCYPVSIQELQGMSGVGQNKAQKYGEEFVKLIAQYVRDNEIERPEDIRVRTVPNKSKLKVGIVQMIDRKVSLEDIASSCNLDFDELLDELEAIVYSGTKINIDYFIVDVLDEEMVEEIYDYFKSSTTDDIEVALEALGSEYEEEDIRIVRIKFLSEIAN